MLDAGLYDMPREYIINNKIRFYLFQDNKGSFILIFYFLMTMSAFIGWNIVSSPWSTLMCLLGMFIAIIYTMPIAPPPFGGKKRKRFKEIGVLKPFMISAAWLCFPLFLLCFEGDVPLARFAYASMIFIFILLFIDCCQLDSADVKGDRRYQICTLSNTLSSQ